MNACPACISESVQRALTLTDNGANSFENYGKDLASLTDQLRSLHSDFESRLTEITSTLTTEEASETFGAYCRHDEHFPTRIAEHHPEVAVIYVCGNLATFEALNEKETLALVGARRASAYGREVAYSFANDAASRGVIVITGMALGVDGAANRGALQGSGETIAFLAGPPTQAYPRSHRLLYEQITQKGCAISIMPPGLQETRAAFQLRSTLIGTLAAGSVFVEGSENSGAMFTLNEARRAGNMVGAVPGPITGPLSSGPNNLIAGDARVICSSDDLFDYDTTEPATRHRGELPDTDRSVLAALNDGHDTPRQLATQLPDLAPRDISAALGRLELLGYIVRADDAYRLN
ncbi:MAG: DNA-protecting protein DprA [Thermoleophilaceae bacterium]|nr:DNA-protecting protein DprA [Thermoleophilaceae bacterium]